MAFCQFDAQEYAWIHTELCRCCGNSWAFNGPSRDFSLILLILNMIIDRSFAGSTYFLLANGWGQGGQFCRVCFCAKDHIDMGQVIIENLSGFRCFPQPFSSWNHIIPCELGLYQKDSLSLSWLQMPWLLMSVGRSSSAMILTLGNVDIIVFNFSLETNFIHLHCFIIKEWCEI